MNNNLSNSNTNSQLFTLTQEKLFFKVLVLPVFQGMIAMTNERYSCSALMPRGEPKAIEFNALILYFFVRAHDITITS